ncbi:MAG: hypothetical protein ABI230_10365, partial [Aestuariivirga sp.]
VLANEFQDVADEFLAHGQRNRRMARKNRLQHAPGPLPSTTPKTPDRIASCAFARLFYTLASIEHIHFRAKIGPKGLNLLNSSAGLVKPKCGRAAVQSGSLSVNMRFFDGVIFLQHSLMLYESHGRIVPCQLLKPIWMAPPANIAMG